MAKYNKPNDEETKVFNPEPEVTPVTSDVANETEPAVEKPEEKVEEKPVVKSSAFEVKYREVVYLGIANEAERIGAVTGNIYIFRKNAYDMPEPAQVDERDYPGLVSEKGKGCARRDASILFMSKLEWDLEIEQARLANSA